MAISWMREAIIEAQKAQEQGEVPVGAVIIHQNRLISRAGNRVCTLSDPTAHAEILVIREACRKLGTERLTNAHLYVTLEPCAMCAAAIAHARIDRLYYGATDNKTGAVESHIHYFSHAACQHKTDVYGGIQETQCRQLLIDFFKTLR